MYVSCRVLFLNYDMFPSGLCCFFWFVVSVAIHHSAFSGWARIYGKFIQHSRVLNTARPGATSASTLIRTERVQTWTRFNDNVHRIGPCAVGVQAFGHNTRRVVPSTIQL